MARIMQIRTHKAKRQVSSFRNTSRLMRAASKPPSLTMYCSDVSTPALLLRPVLSLIIATCILKDPAAQLISYPSHYSSPSATLIYPLIDHVSSLTRKSSCEGGYQKKHRRSRMPPCTKRFSNMSEYRTSWTIHWKPRRYPRTPISTYQINVQNKRRA
jgi:hypothetical protein